MKKVFFTGLVLLTLLALLTGTVAAAPLADGVLTLIEVRNDRGGAVILVFYFSGEFSKSQLRGGRVIVDGESFGLSCSQVSDETIQCTTTRRAGGHNVVVNLAGFNFWVFVPAARGGTAPSQYCYGVYDVYFDSESESVFWGQFDTHCQDSPANFGDVLPDFYNPDYQDYNDYEFMPGSPAGCFDPVDEDAYYYPSCPS